MIQEKVVTLDFLHIPISSYFTWQRVVVARVFFVNKTPSVKTQQWQELWKAPEGWVFLLYKE